MTIIVADTAALVSLGTVVDHEPSPLSLFLTDHIVIVPEQVLDELNETVTYTDVSGEAAQAVVHD